MRCQRRARPRLSHAHVLRARLFIYVYKLTCGGGRKLTHLLRSLRDRDRHSKPLAAHMQHAKTSMLDSIRRAGERKRKSEC